MSANNIIVLYEQIPGSGLQKTNYVLMDQRTYLLAVAKAKAFKKALIETYNTNKSIPNNSLIKIDDTIFYSLNEHAAGTPVDKIVKMCPSTGSGLIPGFNPDNSYSMDDIVLYGDSIYYCVKDTTGTWDPASWILAPTGLKINTVKKYGYETFIGDIYTMSGALVKIDDLQFSDRPLDLTAIQQQLTPVFGPIPRIPGTGNRTVFIDRTWQTNSGVGINGITVKTNVKPGVVFELTAGVYNVKLKEATPGVTVSATTTESGELILPDTVGFHFSINSYGSDTYPREIFPYIDLKTADASVKTDYVLAKPGTMIGSTRYATADSLEFDKEFFAADMVIDFRHHE